MPNRAEERLLAHERQNNPVLRCLNDPPDNLDLRSVVRVLFDQQDNICVFVPRANVMRDIPVTTDFLEAHTVVMSQHPAQRFVSINGVKGVLTRKKDKVLLLRDPPKEFDLLTDFSPVFEDEIYEDESVLATAPSVAAYCASKTHVGSRKALYVRYVLISEPLVYSGCEWGLDAQSAPPQPSFTDSDSDTDGGRRRLSTRGLGESAMNLFSDGDSSASPCHSAEEAVPSPRASQLVARRSRKTSSFLQHMNNPQCAEVVRSIKRFVQLFSVQTPPEDARSAAVRKFISAVHERLEVHPLFKKMSESEFDDILEGLEKYIMTKIFTKVFPPSQASVAEDDVLRKKMERMQWIKPEHIEIQKLHVHEHSISLAIGELHKINTYKPPRDKMVCVLNCCKIIYNVLNQSGDISGADDFLPILIYVVIKANPAQLQSNIQYILNFRNPDKLATESGYYFTQLEAAVHFIRDCTAAMLNIDAKEYERLVNARPSRMAPALTTKTKAAKFSASSTPSSPTKETLPLDALIPDATSATSAVPVVNNEALCYLHADFEDLTMRDVRQLLEEYKKLARQHAVLLSMVKTQSSEGGDPSRHKRSESVQLQRSHSTSVAAADNVRKPFSSVVTHLPPPGGRLSASMVTSRSSEVERPRRHNTLTGETHLSKEANSTSDEQQQCGESSGDEDERESRRRTGSF